MTKRPSGLVVPSELRPPVGLGPAAPALPDAPEKTLYVIGQVPSDMDTVVAAIDPRRPRDPAHRTGRHRRAAARGAVRARRRGDRGARRGRLARRPRPGGAPAPRAGHLRGPRSPPEDRALPAPGPEARYRLLDAAAHRPHPVRSHKPATLRFTRFHGELVERYVVDVARRSHATQQRAGIVRISDDAPYTGRDGTESRSSDLVLDFGTDLVVVEVTGGRPPRRARILSEPSVMREVLDDKVIKKLRELDDATIDPLDGLDLDGLDLELVERVLAGGGRAVHDPAERRHVGAHP